MGTTEIVYVEINRTFIDDLIKRLTFILSHSENWDMESLYPEYYNKGKELISFFQSNTKIEKEVFQETNNFIVDYCNGFEENELHTTDIKLYQALMNYTTNYLYKLGFEVKDASYYRVV